MRNKKRFMIFAVVSCIILLILIILFVNRMSERISLQPEQNTSPAEESSEPKTGLPGEETREEETEFSAIENGETEIELLGEETNKTEAELLTSQISPSATEMQDVSEESEFYHMPLTDELKTYITGGSYPDTDKPLQISYEELEYVHVLHYDFEGQVQEGELICNQAIAQDLTEIFKELYDNQYPIEKIRLIDEYDADDDASMEDNNTSCFNYRVVEGKTTLSNHSYGLAVDINPLYNPYVRTKDGETLVSPENAVPYADRSMDFPYKIDENDLCCQLFVKYGFTWGGNWNSVKDYQHFEKR